MVHRSRCAIADSVHAKPILLTESCEKHFFCHNKYSVSVPAHSAPTLAAALSIPARLRETGLIIICLLTLPWSSSLDGGDVSRLTITPQDRSYEGNEIWILYLEKIKMNKKSNPNRWLRLQRSKRWLSWIYAAERNYCQLNVIRYWRNH